VTGSCQPLFTLTDHSAAPGSQSSRIVVQRLEEISA